MSFKWALIIGLFLSLRLTASPVSERVSYGEDDGISVSISRSCCRTGMVLSGSRHGMVSTGSTADSSSTSRPVPVTGPA